MRAYHTSLVSEIYSTILAPIVFLHQNPLLSAVGYLLYSLAHSFWAAVIGLIILGLFSSSASVGFTTYTQKVTQKVIQAFHMGRINSVVGPPQQLLNIVFILLGGFLATWLVVRILMVGMTALMSLAALIIVVLVFLPRNQSQMKDATSNNAF